jgi:predicted DsbA family dithiol-disulfide isomerase
LQEAAETAGLDAEEMGRTLRERRYMEQAFKAVAAAKDGGVTSTPTYILGRTAIKGWHYYEVFQTVMEKQGMLPRAHGGSIDRG